MLNKKRGAFNMKYNDRSEFEKVDSFGIGAPNDAYAQYFIGNSFLKTLTEFGKAPVFMANVTFEPKCSKLDYVA